jgi:uncharacterized protein (TIGR00251 family)
MTSGRTIDPASLTAAVTAVGDGVRVRVKAAPGARRSRVVGLLGDRLKVAVTAPPEDGKANAALCELLADTLGLPAREVEVIEGRSAPLKVLEARGVALRHAVERLAKAVNA